MLKLQQGFPKRGGILIGIPKMEEKETIQPIGMITQKDAYRISGAGNGDPEEQKRAMAYWREHGTTDGFETIKEQIRRMEKEKKEENRIHKILDIWMHYTNRDVEGQIRQRLLDDKLINDFNEKI